MLNVISIIPPSLEKFLGEFKGLFIKPQFENFKDKEIVYHFSRRWKTEDSDRDAKDNLAFDQY